MKIPSAGSQYASLVVTAYFAFAMLVTGVFVLTLLMNIAAPAVIDPWNMLAGPAITTPYGFALFFAWDAWKNRNPRARLGITLTHLIYIVGSAWKAWDIAGDPAGALPPVDMRPTAAIAIQIGAAAVLALWLVALHTPALDRYLNAPTDEQPAAADS